MDKEAKKKVGGVVPMLAFIYAMLILTMVQGYMKLFAIGLFQMKEKDAEMVSFVIGAFLAIIGFKGVKALFIHK